MKIKSTISGIVVLVLAMAILVPAQVEAGPAWQVLRYDITANVLAGERVLSGRAQLSIRNVGRGPGPRLTLRINSRAEIKAVMANGASATFRSSQDAQRNQQRVEITLPSPAAPNSTFNVAVEYQLPVVANNQLAAMSPLGTQFLPLAYWYPTPSNFLSPRGGDTAPFRMTITNTGGETTLSSGKLNAGAFDEPLYGQPFFISGSWDSSEGTGEAKGITIFMPKGLNADERRQADTFVALAGAARTYFAGLLGPAPEAPVRLIGVNRGGGFSDSGTLLIDAAAFRRAKTDIVTSRQIVEMVARLWIGGVSPIRAEGHGVIREGLVQHLATSFIEKQFGAETADAERMRLRASFAVDARRDAPLSLTTPLDPSYFASVGNKGAMVWRLVERVLGRDTFFEVLRAQLQSSSGEGQGLTLVGLREAFGARGGEPVKQLLQYQLDKATETDLIVGLPQARGGEWVVALRNEGGMDLATSVVALTEGGDRLKNDVVIAARSFGEAVFKTSGKIKRVEIDPEKIYPQVDYANDVAPRQTSGEEPLAESLKLFQRQEPARAETLLRDLLSSSPNAEDARVLLGRALLAQNKFDEGEKELRAVLALRATTPTNLAWSNIGLGEIALRRGQAAQAARYFDEAVRTAADYATGLAARAGRIKAEAATSSPPVPDESARAFVAQLDKTILGGRKAEIEQQIVPGELVNFAKAIVGSQPEVWQSQVLRTEQLDAYHMAVDISLNVKQLGRELSGRPVLILARVGNVWKLAEVEYFDEVR